MHEIGSSCTEKAYLKMPIWRLGKYQPQVVVIRMVLARGSLPITLLEFVYKSGRMGWYALLHDPPLFINNAVEVVEGCIGALHFLVRTKTVATTLQQVTILPEQRLLKVVTEAVRPWTPICT